MANAVGDEIDLLVGPFRDIFAVPDPGSGKPTRLFDADNMVIPDPRNGSAILARHGFQGQLEQLGASDDARTGQGVFGWRRLDGTLERFAFGGGKMYRWDGAADFEDITPAGIEIHETNPVGCSAFNGELLISDENNKPWIYTPETGLGVQIEYNTAAEEWSSKGPPYVYSGYPVFIARAVGAADLQAENSDNITTEDDLLLSTELLSGFQNMLVYGNALDPRTGYDQDGYDHVWQLTQTSNELLGALFADENALMYLRNEGIGRITGPIGENWRANATRDGVSSTVGTDTPFAVVAVDDNLFFLDPDGRPYWMPLSGKPVPLWLPLRRDIEENFSTSQNRANVLAYARAAYHKEYDMVLFTIWDRTTLYGFNARTGAYLGTWSVGGGIHITAMGLVPDSLSRATFVLLGTRSTSFTESAKGVFWKQKHSSDSSQWLDQADASVASYTAFTRAIETHWLAHRAAMSYRIHKVIAELVGDIAAHAVRLIYKTPAIANSTAIVAQSSVTVGAENDQDAIATAKWSLSRNAQGSKIRLRLEATHSDNVRFGVHSIVAKAAITEARPR